jgi:hypothetical protein
VIKIERVPVFRLEEGERMKTLFAVVLTVFLLASVATATVVQPKDEGSYSQSISTSGPATAVATQSQSQRQDQSQSNSNLVSNTNTNNAGQTISPNQRTEIIDNSTNMGLYPFTWTTPMPNMQAPTTPKAWQLSLSMWAEGSSWPYANIGTMPPNVEMHGRLFTKSKGSATTLRTFKAMPKGAYKVGSYVAVAKVKDVDATMLEDAAMYQGKTDKASGIVERERHFYARNNYKGSSGGLGMAMSILGSIAGNATGFGPNAGFQTGSYVSDQDVYIYLSFDTISD